MVENNLFKREMYLKY